MKKHITYKAYVKIPGPGKMKDLKDFNRLWGFEDGAANEFNKNNEIVSKPMDEDERKMLEKAHHLFHCVDEVEINVDLYKDGSRKYSIVKKGLDT